MENLSVIQLSEERYRQNLCQAAQLGAHQALRMAGLPVREYYTRAELQRRYGRGVINSLLSKHKLTPHKLPAADDETKQRVVYSETEFLSQMI